MKKKGFTLIELLAVIVILAIILAIAIPGISGIIESARKNAFASNAKLVIDTIRLKKLENDSLDIESLTKDNIDELLNIDNVNYESLNVTLVNGKVSIAIVGDNKWDGLVACGTYYNMTINEGTSCTSTSGTEQFAYYEGESYPNGVATYDNGFVVAETNYDSLDCYASLAKYGTDGGLIWRKSLNGGNSDSFYDAGYGDNYFVAVGDSASVDGDFLGLNNGSGDAIIAKYEQDGDLVWLKNLGGSNPDSFSSVVVTSDGYVAVGNTNSEDGDLNGLNHGTTDGLIAKYDFDGNLVWIKSFGGIGADYFGSIAVASDGYIVVGNTNSTDGDLEGISVVENPDAILIKYDFNGNLVWVKNYGGSAYDYYYDVSTLSDGYVVAGNSNSTDGDLLNLNKGDQDAILVKYDFNGNIIWQRNFGGSGYDAFYSMFTVNNNIFVSGSSASTDQDLSDLDINNDDAILIQYDNSGSIISKKNYGENGADYFGGISNIDNDIYGAIYIESVIIGNVPTITLLGDEPITVTQGEAYVDPGATASDTEDGDLTSAIQTTSDVNINVIGNYAVSYSVTDSDGNTAMNLRRVQVVEPTTLASCFIFNEATGTITDYGDQYINDSPAYYHRGTCPSDVIIPSSINGVNVQHIDTEAFREEGLTSVVIPSTVTTIGDNAFYGNLMTGLTLNNGIVDIGYGAFDYNSLTTVTIPNSVTSIGNYAFRQSQIDTLTLGSSLITIGMSSFENNKITNLTIPNSVTTISNSAFASNLISSITLGTSVQSIGGTAFYNNQLTSLTIPSSVTTIGQSAFSNNSISSLSLPSTVTSIGIWAFNFNQLPTANAFIYSSATDTQTLMSYGGSNRTSITIPSGTVTILDEVFSGLNITSLTIPNTVTAIYSGAFSYNSLTSVAIPNSVTSIGVNAFRYNLIPQGSATIDRQSGTVTIGSGAFNNNGPSKATTITPVYLR